MPWFVATLAPAFFMVLDLSRPARLFGQESAIESDRSMPLLAWQIPVESNGDSESPWGTPLQMGRIPMGSRIILRDEPGSGHVLTPQFWAAGFPDLAHDAKRLMFVGRLQEGDPWAMWELTLSDRSVRRILSCPSACDRVIFLSKLYSIGGEGPIPQIAFRAIDEMTGVPAIFRCRFDGSDVQQITFSPNGAADMLSISDGRLLFFSANRTDGPRESERDRSPSLASGLTTMFTINIDGTDLFPFSSGTAIQRDPSESTNGRIIFVEEREDDSRVKLIAGMRTNGSTSADVLIETESDLRRPLAITNRRIIAARRTNSPSTSAYHVGQYDSASDRWTIVVEDPMFHSFPAARVEPRVPPQGRSSVVKSGVDVGQLYCLNASLHDGNVVSTERGEIRRVRVRTPVSAHFPTGILGDIEVESDGSFFAEMPARLPIALETLDEKGKSLQRMRSWFWVMPMERRGCIGCHEDREMTPPNRHVFALRKPPQRIGVRSEVEVEKE